MHCPDISDLYERIPSSLSHLSNDEFTHQLEKLKLAHKSCVLALENESLETRPVPPPSHSLQKWKSQPDLQENKKKKIDTSEKIDALLSTYLEVRGIAPKQSSLTSWTQPDPKVYKNLKRASLRNLEALSLTGKELDSKDYGLLLRTYRSSSEDEDNEEEEGIIEYLKSIPPPSSQSQPDLCITVPKPFSMTERDELERDEKERRRQKAIKDKLAKERAECNSHFRANPVPLHVRLPLYNYLMHKQDERRIRNHTLYRARLQADMQPFSFTKREEKLKGQFSNSTPDLRSFKASPFPKHLFSDNATKRREEEKLIRCIKREMRKHSMLEASSLPPNMIKWEKIKKQRKHFTQDDNNNKMEKKHVSAKSPPDYDKAFRNWEDKLASVRETRPLTCVSPFNLSSNSKPKKNLLNVSEPRRSRSATTSPVHQSLYVGPMRKHLTRHKCFDEEPDSREKEGKYRDSIRRSLSLTAIPTSNQDIQKQLKARLSAQRWREREYKRELQEIEDRVNRRPTLIQRQIKESARRRALVKFEKILRKQGLTSESLERSGILNKKQESSLSSSQETTSPPDKKALVSFQFPDDQDEDFSDYNISDSESIKEESEEQNSLIPESSLEILPKQMETREQQSEVFIEQPAEQPEPYSEPPENLSKQPKIYSEPSEAWLKQSDAWSKQPQAYLEQSEMHSEQADAIPKQQETRAEQESKIHVDKIILRQFKQFTGEQISSEEEREKNPPVILTSSSDDFFEDFN